MAWPARKSSILVRAKAATQYQRVICTYLCCSKTDTNFSKQKTAHTRTIGVLSSPLTSRDEAHPRVTRPNEKHRHTGAGLYVCSSSKGNHAPLSKSSSNFHLRVRASRVVVLHVRSRAIETEQAVLQGHELQVLVEYLGDDVNTSFGQGFSCKELHQGTLELAR